MRRSLFLFLFLWLSGLCIAQSPIHSSEAIQHPVIGKQGMVASQHYIATEVGLEILKKGGNAIDAAVAVGFSLAVVLPRAGNLGGGGFMMIYLAETDQTLCINYRETAPAASTQDMYLDARGNVDKQLYNQSYLSVGIPGTVAGLSFAQEKYGSLPLKEVLAPAILLAEKGFPVSYDLERLLKKYEDRLKKCKASAKVFFKENEYYEAGNLLVQKDLAWSLKEIAKNGKDAFYRAELADRLIQGIQAQGGIISREDLENYKVELVEPVKGTFRDYEIVSMPPPSSGGVHIIQMLNILAAFPLKELGHNSAESLHLLAESMRLAYADRSSLLGDPDFWDVPEKGICSKAYADKLRQKINRSRANLSSEIRADNPFEFESPETTHFSVVDRFGNVVSNSYTLNFSYGSGLMIDGTGILLNNEMGDFSAKPGAPNAYGLIGGQANAIESGKQPLSSMSPTIVFKEGRPYLATGSPGGSRIITNILQLLLNVLEYDMNIAEATHTPRIHHQWYPDILFCERGISPDTQNLLRAKGHNIETKTSLGSTQSIMIKDGLLYGASDPRRPDAKTMGY